MRQIRSFKEENEQKLNDVIVSKTNQMDKLRDEFDSRVGEFEQEILRSAAENEELSRSLQELSNMVVRISEEKKMKNTESANQLELMDDFLEMEKLACLPNDENTNGHSSADSDAETLAAMQLKKSISTVLQSLPKDAAMEKILAEVQCAIEDAGGAPSECHGPNLAAAAEKLQECQETILLLGKQLKSVSSNRTGCFFSKPRTNPKPRRR
ncbi:unnamed protein product [Brassica oleracea]